MRNMDESEGIHGKLVEGKVIQIGADKFGNPMFTSKGMFKRKNGRPIPFVHLILSDGSGILVKFGKLNVGILIKTEDINREAERILDKEVDLRRTTNSDFDSKVRYAQEKKAIAAIQEYHKTHGPDGTQGAG
jgi:hypothetical protein